MSLPEIKNTATAPGIPVIAMQNVAVGSWLEPETTVLTDVNWSVTANDFWVVAGMHGSGKRDLIYTAAGLMPPLSGVHHLFGQDATALTDKQVALRLRVGLVF